jgi:hypothetical protein
MTYHESPIQLGDTYRDKNTGFTGAAIAVAFWQHRCARVCLVALVNQVPAEHWFEEPNLIPTNGVDKNVGFTPPTC